MYLPCTGVTTECTCTLRAIAQRYTSRVTYGDVCQASWPGSQAKQLSEQSEKLSDLANNSMSAEPSNERSTIEHGREMRLRERERERARKVLSVLFSSIVL